MLQRHTLLRVLVSVASEFALVRCHLQSSALKSLTTRAFVYVRIAKNMEDSTNPTPVIQ